MSQENVEILRRFEKVFQTGDLERVVSEFFDPEIEWRASAEDPDAATHRGPEAYKRYVEQW
jgi:ketosteroid isomerase-like protein